MTRDQLKVCLVTHTFAPFSRGGVETYSADLGRELRQAGVDVVLFHPFSDQARPDWLVERVVVDGLDVIRLNRHGLSPTQELGDERLEALFASLLHDERIDVVHFHHLAESLTPSLITAAYASGVRTVLTLHDSWTACAKAHPIRWDGTRCVGPESVEMCARCLSHGTEPSVQMLDYVAGRNTALSRSLALCDQITSPSDYQARFVESAPWFTRSIERRPSGLTLRAADRRPPASSGPGRGAEPLRLVTLANFSVQPDGSDVKGSRVLAAAATQLGPNVARFHVYGAVDEQTRVLFERSGNVVVHGSYRPDELSEIFADADALVITSLMENYPTVAREAFDHGVPVIASDVGGLREIVTHDVDGLIVPSGDAGALVDAVRSLHGDRTMLVRLRGNVRPPLSMDADAARWIETYRGLAGTFDVPEGDDRITVVIATYGRSRELRSCLEALCGQTLATDRFEVVVVDDCSPDPAAPIVEEFADRLNIVHIRHEVNKGLGETRNTGVDASTAAMTLFLDDDDVAGPRLLAEHLRAHGVHRSERTAILGFTGLMPELLASNLLQHVMLVGQQYLSYPALREGVSLPWHCGWGGRTSYKTSLIKRVRFASRWMEDTEINWRLHLEGLDVRLARNAVQFITEATDLDGFLRRTRNLGAVAAELAALDPNGLGKFLAVEGSASGLAAQDAAAAEFAAMVRQLIPLAPSHLRSQTIEVGSGRVPLDQLLHHGVFTMVEAERLRGAAIAQRVLARAEGEPTLFVCVAEPSNMRSLMPWVEEFAAAFTANDAVSLVVLVDALIHEPDAVLARLEELARECGLVLDDLADIAITPVVETPWSALEGAFWLPINGAPAPDGLISLGDRSTRDQFRQAAGLQPVSRELRQGASIEGSAQVDESDRRPVDGSSSVDGAAPIRCFVVGNQDLGDPSFHEFVAVLGALRRRDVEVSLVMPADGMSTSSLPDGPWTVYRPADEQDIDALAWWLQAASDCVDVWIVVGRSHPWAAVALQILAQRCAVVLDLCSHDLGLVQLPGINEDLAAVRLVTSSAEESAQIATVVPGSMPLIALDRPRLDVARRHRSRTVAVLHSAHSGRVANDWGALLTRDGFSAVTIGEDNPDRAWPSIPLSASGPLLASAAAVLVPADHVDDGTIGFAIANGTPLLVEPQHALGVALANAGCGFALLRSADISMALALLSCEDLASRLRETTALAAGREVLERSAERLAGVLRNVASARRESADHGLDDCRSEVVLVPIGAPADLKALGALCQQFDDRDDLTVVVCLAPTASEHVDFAELDRVVMAGHAPASATDVLFVADQLTPQRVAALVRRSGAVLSTDPGWQALALLHGVADVSTVLDRVQPFESVVPVG